MRWIYTNGSLKQSFTLNCLIRTISSPLLTQNYTSDTFVLLMPICEILNVNGFCQWYFIKRKKGSMGNANNSCNIMMHIFKSSWKTLGYIKHQTLKIKSRTREVHKISFPCMTRVHSCACLNNSSNCLFNIRNHTELLHT